MYLDAYVFPQGVWRVGVFWIHRACCPLRPELARRVGLGADWFELIIYMGSPEPHRLVRRERGESPALSAKEPLRVGTREV